LQIAHKIYTPKRRFFYLNLPHIWNLCLCNVAKSSSFLIAHLVASALILLPTDRKHIATSHHGCMTSWSTSRHLH